MTERELSQAVHLKAEPEAPRRVAAIEPSTEVLRAIGEHAKAVESARLEITAFIQQVRAREKGQTMRYALRDEQTIAVYNTLSDEGDRCLYEGKVGDMGHELRSRLRMASFYLPSDAGEYGIIAII